MRKLLEGDFEGYFRENADTPDALWFFVHIPKTAGSTFRSELAAKLKPETNITLNYAVAPEEFENWRQAALQRFASEHQQAPRRFASGHIMNRLLGDLRGSIPKMRMITMLRHPVARLISDFRYARTPAHPPYQDFIKRYPTVEDYVNAPESADKMAAFLESRPGQPAKELIRELESSFSFVGLTEMYPVCRRTLFTLIGIPAGPIERKRKTESTADNQVEVTPELRSRIIQANRRDMAIYRHFRDRWAQQKGPVLEYLKSGRSRTR